LGSALGQNNPSFDGQAIARAQSLSPEPTVDNLSLPLSFVPNEGQIDPTVRFQAHPLGGTIFFTPAEVDLSLPVATSAETTAAVVRMQFEAANPVGPYDPTQPLIIDPYLVYSTLIGGLNNEEGRDIAVDSAGNAYLTGSTLSTNFPTKNTLKTNKEGLADAVIAQFDTTKSGSASHIFSTYFGGSRDDFGMGIA